MARGSYIASASPKSIHKELTMPMSEDEKKLLFGKLDKFAERQTSIGKDVEWVRKGFEEHKAEHRAITARMWTACLMALGAAFESVFGFLKGMIGGGISQ